MLLRLKMERKENVHQCYKFFFRCPEGFVFSVSSIMSVIHKTDCPRVSSPPPSSQTNRGDARGRKPGCSHPLSKQDPSKQDPLG